ncbi:hypothetical protein [Variovorax sp. IB41]|uniref:hypothetical protein n=1 Tax=Variovorax sp. IB41 TaxID=2779370 RepID=UPI0018E6EE64|nr:hypothetical protein [Variovorax sp. IB41]MBJ2158004.1 hypothetical protein [Variovorax sp. IB41]
MFDTPDTITALPPISTAPEADAAFDPRALFNEGLATVRRLSRGLWTDHNTHDPGITMLEVACYALTELSYRHSLPIEDLLTAPGESNAQTMARLHQPRTVLPNRALTELDWRKLLIDLPDVKNAWIEAVTDSLLYADLRRHELRTTPPAHPAFEPVPLAGLYRVRIEFMDSVNTQVERAAVLEAVRNTLETSRNLCEDFIEVRAVRAEYFALCAEIDLEGDADPVEAAARLLFDVGQAIAPPVLNHDLATLLARGLTLPEILDGPLLEHGFIDDTELQTTALPLELRLSDLIGVAMDVPGIRSVRNMLLNPLVRTDENDEDAPDADPTDVQGDAAPLANAWRIPVRAGRLPRLSLNQGRLVFAKRGLAVQGWNIADMPASVAARLAELREAARVRVEQQAGTEVPLPASGRARVLDAWTSFQQDFPAVYGIGPQGLGLRATDARRVQALQLQGWLLFFDHAMAGQLSMLTNARRQLSVAPADLQDVALRFSGAGNNRHTLSAQIVTSIADDALLYPAGATPRMLADAIETSTEAASRQQRLLDHLLSRVAEDFADYAGAMASAFGYDSDRLIGDRCRFLQEVAELSRDRAGAFEQRPATAEAVWNTPNVSGLERRVARLLGIADFTRRNLGLQSYDTYNEIDAVPDSINEFRFRVRHAVTNAILLSSSTRYPTPEAARAAMILAIERAQLPGSYQRAMTAGAEPKPYFNIVDAAGEVIARRIQYFDSAAAMETAIADLITYLAGHYGGEGMYLVEHILLRPRAATDRMFDICTDAGCGDCSELDPYSYRVHVLLPAYAGRFQNEGFRRFAEEVIRAEMPAHILPTVCWVGSNDMAEFEGAWRNWLMVHAGFGSTTEATRQARLDALIDVLQRAKNIYPSRALFDCTSDETKPPFILGRTSIGTQPSGGN